jgi:hypothetical protein
MTMAELATWYKDRSYQFIAMGEHSQDLSEEKVERLKTLCVENSDAQFYILPGIEYSCRGGIHIFAPGTTRLIQETDPVAVANDIRSQGGFAILAHPQRLGWNCPEELLLAVDAVEIWNVSYDGKYLPSFRAPKAFRRMQRVNPHLQAIAGHDFHRKAGFYDIGVEIEVGELSQSEVLKEIKQGRYAIASRFFRTDAQARLPWGKWALLHLLSWQLKMARRARDWVWNTKDRPQINTDQRR